MKHNIKITAMLLGMFLVTQLIGLYVVNFYMSDGIQLPYGFNQQVPEKATTNDYTQFLIGLVISFAIAVFLVFILMRISAVWFLRAWFFVVIALALGLTITIVTMKFGIIYPSFFALLIGIVLAYIKVFQKNILVHNLTELLIYPGIAAIFVSFLNLGTTIIILILISIYDIWAVWHSGVMQKMAKFQMNSVGVFGGFFIPYASKKIKEKIKLLRLKFKEQKIPEHVIKKHNIKINLAILGGGDVVFPIIAAGVVLKTFNNIWSAIAVIIGATLALLYLFLLAKKRKYYPAMPYLTTGILIGMLVGWAISAI
jgi:presenilin-like A22 family membrane protease